MEKLKREYLLFTYHAPIAAFGQIAVGEVRDSWDRPGKSAILGLCAAALGLVRENTEAQAALAKSYGYAVRTDASGSLLSDYHTVQTASRSNVKKMKATTRREVLAAGNVNTTLSNRSYVCDGLFTVCLWAVTKKPRWSLSKLGEALDKPTFLPYAGRKSCPFTLLFKPELVVTVTLKEAFAKRISWPEGLCLGGFNKGNEASKLALKMLAGEKEKWGREIAYDADGTVGDLQPMFTRERRDQVADRDRWQFAQRAESIATLPISKDSES